MKKTNTLSQISGGEYFLEKVPPVVTATVCVTGALALMYGIEEYFPVKFNIAFPFAKITNGLHFSIALPLTAPLTAFRPHNPKNRLF